MLTLLFLAFLSTRSDQATLSLACDIKLTVAEAAEALLIFADTPVKFRLFMVSTTREAMSFALLPLETLINICIRGIFEMVGDCTVSWIVSSARAALPLTKPIVRVAVSVGPDGVGPGAASEERTVPRAEASVQVA